MRLLPPSWPRALRRIAAGALGLFVPALAAGVETNRHWAYQPLLRPQIPVLTPGAGGASLTNPIDRFVRAQLAQQHRVPSAAADPRTLIRRVTLDLTGLPPTPEEVAAFVAEFPSSSLPPFSSAVAGEEGKGGSGEKERSAYERLVDRLLASPRHGERWARHWMDAAHFAETHGHDQDRIRTNAWPYRDYLITSFNADKPYARFVQEQVAGDALFPEDPQATVALGLIAAGPWDESSLRDIREDTIDRQIGRYLDRDDMLTTVMQTFTSSTVQCARCHDHKFDPIPQRDYYALQAVFAGVDRANRVYDADPATHQRRQTLLRERRLVERGDRGLLLAEAAQREAAAWERARTNRPVDWKRIEPQTFLSAGGAALTRQPDGSVLASGVRPERETYTISASSPLSNVTAVRLEVLADDSLPKKGPGRQDNGNLHLSEFQLLMFEPGANTARNVALTNATADFNQTGWTIGHALDGNEKTAWGVFPKVGESHQAVFELVAPLTLTPGHTLVFVLRQLHGEGHVIGRVRLSATAARPPLGVETFPSEIESILALPASQRDAEQRARLAAFVLKERLTRQFAALPKPALVYAAASEFEPDGGLKPAGGPRPVQMLKRGDIHKPIEPAEPGALVCVEALPARFHLEHPDDEAARRAALARWLTDRSNPLTWRSIVNRVWHHHFGHGLVDTPNDFGRMGAAPSHRELLDWLAVWFRDDAGGSLKQLHRLIVTSETYRQASSSEFRVSGSGFRVSGDATAPTQNAELGTRNAEPETRNSLDPDNRLLSRMNRTRLDAEQVRDSILQMAGRLDLRMGGPGDLEFDLQPGHHVTPRVDYTKFDVAGHSLRRRGVYRFLFRTLPDPFMDALDCPAGDQLTPVRNASVTVQQALALWNNAFVAHYAEVLARRLETAAKVREAQVTLACELVWSRPPSAEELHDLGVYAHQHGLASLCRVLLNSNEFMFVN